METIKLKVLNQTGHTLMTCDADQAVSLVYTGVYQPGDRIALEIDHPGQFCVVQFEDTMDPALIYVVSREINFHIPFGEQAITYSPKSFKGSRHLIRARLARPDELAVRRNLAFNCYDQHGDTGYYPHASANVETRGEAVFAARNAIDGIFENSSHGEYPYQSWGINRDPKPQSITFPPRRVRSLVLSQLIQAEGPSPFPALTQIEAWGYECLEGGEAEK